MGRPSHGRGVQRRVAAIDGRAVRREEPRLDRHDAISHSGYARHGAKQYPAAGTRPLHARALLL
jgi:hypothetical protein